MTDQKLKETNELVYIPSDKKRKTINSVLQDFVKMRNVINKSYNEFNGRSLYEAIDDWMKRWMGYIPPVNPLIDPGQSHIFVNFTRNAIIQYLSKVAMDPPTAKIVAIDKRTNIPNKRAAELFSDLNQYSLNAENGPARFLESALECVIKGTVIVYEGYQKNKQKVKVPIEFDAETGEMKFEETERTVNDNCFQRIWPLEDFYISNPFQPDLQKQPKIIAKAITTHSEAALDYGHYPDWKYVIPGKYTIISEPTIFYKNKLYTELQPDQVEILLYYEKAENRHVVLINGIVIYDGPIPFKDGNYPFAKNVNEPFHNQFFWGNGHPNKYMGEQDLINTFVNMMADKTINSLLPFGLSSDLDDLIDDDVLEGGKIRKVSDINNWKFDTLPGISAGEQAMLQTVLNFAKDSSNTGGASNYSPKGGKLQARQILLQQQEAMQKMSFNMNFLEDLERDRTELRLHHILQFYSIPRVEKVLGPRGKQIEKFLYRDVRLANQKLQDGKMGSKVIKLVGDIKNQDERQKLADELSVTEQMGEISGTPTEAVAMSVDQWTNYDFEIQVIKNSSFEKNQALDQAMRRDYAQWRLYIAPLVPVDGAELVKWVDEAYDVDPDQFTPQTPQGLPGMPPGAPGQPGQPGQPPPGPTQPLAPKAMKSSEALLQ